MKKNSLLCPRCRRLISRDEPSCPHCGLRSPASWWKNNRVAAALSDPSRFVRLIIYTNIAMYALSLLLKPGGASLAINPFDFLSPSNGSLLLLGASGSVPILKLHRWWSLVSANYLHGSLLHILFNMMALSQLGPLVIHEYGGYRMLAIYTLGGACGFLVSFFAGVHFTIGASAAVCSLIGAMLFFGKSRGGAYGKALYSQIFGWAIGIFIFGFLVPGINNWGHGGGMAAGALLGFVLGYQDRGRETPLHRTLGMGCIIVTALVLAWAVFSSLLYLLLS